MTTTLCRICGAVALAAAVPALLTAQPSGTEHIDFPITGSAAARAEIEMGIAALHNFWYEEARHHFKEAQQLDPEASMAYWGEGMVSFYPWSLGEQRVTAIREVLERLGPDPQARLAKAGTSRERAYLAAIEVLIADGTNASRRQAFAREMRELAAAYPDDLEAQAFLALSLFGAVEHNLRSDSSLREEAVRAAARVLERRPEHPGALHYTIHALDSPETAARALRAAQTYDRQLPDAPHALHMPAHIYVQLARWDDVERVNEAAFAVSDEWVRGEGRSLEQRDYHALSWLPYARLQKGEYRKAWETVTMMRRLVDETGSRNLGWYYAEWYARHVIETGRWQDDPLPRSGFNNRTEFLGVAMNAVRTGDIGTAREVHAQGREVFERSRERSGERAEGAVRWLVTTREIEAVVALAEGNGDGAVSALHDAIAAQEDLPPPNELPDPVKPANELLGEVLLELDRPAEAAEQFRIALTRRPGRAAALIGLARAQVATGDRDAARRTYRTLLAQWRDADEGIAVLTEARDYVGSGGQGGAR